MKAIYLDSVQKLSERDLFVPKMGEKQVLVKVKAVGICGSDVHYWEKGNIGSFVVREPMILGHECAGIVEDAGGAVRLKRGDRVVIEPGVPCHTCEFCLKGQYNLCPNIHFFATPPDDGCLAEYVAFDANFVFPIPDEIDDFGLATLAEPIAVGIFATNRLRPALGDRAVVFGAGVIGIACMLAAKAAGCREVTVADIRADRLARAKELGADHVIDLKQEAPPAAYFDVGYEATGADACFTHLAVCMKSGGKVAAVGLGPDTQTFPMVEFVCREIALLPTFRYANSFPAALHLLRTHREELKKLLTHRMPFTLNGVEEAIQTSFGDPSACKVIIDF